MPQVFFDWEKFSKMFLENVFFFVLVGFFLFWGFVSKNLKNDPSAM
jgi:hypothetical protein